MKKMVLPIIILAVILASGCTQRNVKVDANNGIAINLFTASPSSAYTGEDVIFDLEIENVGGTTARNVQADLFGVEGQWRDSMDNLIDSTLTKSWEIMKQPFPSKDIPGDFRMAQWRVITPVIPQGIAPNRPVEVWVSFDYNTSGHLGVKMVSQDEYRRKQMLGEQVANPFEIINSNGPLKLSIPERYKTPIIIDTSGTEQFETYPFRIQIDNAGNGFPITPEDDGRIRGIGGRLQGTIDLYGPGVEFEDCLGVRSGTHIDLDDADIMVKLRQIGRGSLPIACNIKIDKNVWNNRPEDTMQLIFNIRYRYYVSKVANVQVIGE